ncbi:MAG: EamA/RhaT family transporter, partial [Pseudomonadota bacterium]|nr:EamA/RhaT family transporter [Pseudomonadota bacterium]
AIAFGEELTVPMMVGTSVVMVGVYLTNRKTVPAPE